MKFKSISITIIMCVAFLVFSSTGRCDDSLTVLETGEVGIGTNTPANELQIKSNAVSSDVLTVQQSGGTEDVFAVKEDSAGNAVLDLNQSDGTTTIQLNSAGGSPSYINSGKVGVGTATPDCRFHVHDGNIKVSTSSRNTTCFIDAGTNKLAILNFQEAGVDMFSFFAHTGLEDLRIVYAPYNSHIFKLNKNGDLTITGLYEESDISLKENIQTLTAISSLDNIKKLRGVTYTWKNRTKGDNLQVGLVAQELEAVYPELVQTDKEGLKSIAYSRLTVPLLEAVKELKTENDTLKARLTAVEKTNADLAARMGKLEAALVKK